eukprot:3832816-Rhodomonas_salina.2
MDPSMMRLTVVMTSSSAQSVPATPLAYCSIGLPIVYSIWTRSSSLATSHRILIVRAALTLISETESPLSE